MVVSKKIGFGLSVGVSLKKHLLKSLSYLYRRHKYPSLCVSQLENGIIKPKPLYLEIQQYVI